MRLGRPTKNGRTVLGGRAAPGDGAEDVRLDALGVGAGGQRLARAADRPQGGRRRQLCRVGDDELCLAEGALRLGGLGGHDELLEEAVGRPVGPVRHCRCQQRALLCPLGYLQFGLSGFINITKSIGVFWVGFPQLIKKARPSRVRRVVEPAQPPPNPSSCAVHPPLRPVRSAGKPHPAPDTALATLPLSAPTRSTSRLRPPEPHTRANAEKVGHVRLGRAALRETPRDGRCIVFHRQL